MGRWAGGNLAMAVSYKRRLFGVLQYSVSRRTRELGLRMAIGAGAGEIQRLILSESMKMASWGVPIGLALLGAAA